MGQNVSEKDRCELSAFSLQAVRLSSYQAIHIYGMNLIHGVHAAKLIADENYGKTVAMVDGIITSNHLKDIAGKTKLVTPDHQLVTTARNLGISFGD